MSVNSELAFMAEPNIATGFETVLKKITQELDGFIFAQPGGFFKKSNTQHFLDNNLNLILDNNGNCEINDIDVKVDAKIPRPTCR